MNLVVYIILFLGLTALHEIIWINYKNKESKKPKVLSEPNRLRRFVVENKEGKLNGIYTKY